MFRIPIEEVVTELPLTTEVCEALTRKTGVLGNLMRSIDGYERVDLPALEAVRPGQLARYIAVFRSAAAEAQLMRAQLAGMA